MPIEFHCSGCRRLLKTPDDSRGKKARCPQCGAILDVPDATRGAPETGAPFSDPTEKTFTEANPFADGAAPGGAPGTDARNPYAAPSPFAQELNVQPKAVGLVHTRVDTQTFLSETYRIFTGFIAPLLIFGLVLIGVKIALQILSSVFTGFAQATGDEIVIALFSLASFAFSMAVQLWISLGTANYMIKVTRHGRAELSDLFDIARFYVPGLLITLFITAVGMGIGFVVLLPGGVSFITGEPGIIISVFVVLGIVAAAALTVWGMRVYLSLFFLIDRNTGVLESVKLSGQYMQGNKLSVFLAGLIIAILGLIFGCATLCIGFLFVTPFFGLFGAVVYMLVTGQPLVRTNTA